MNVKQLITSNLYSMLGWRTNRHIIIIESDDWGSIRMPSLETYNALISNGVKLGRYGYEKVDTIASREDLEHLFEICNSFRDINGNPVVITANAVVVNPDFERIKEVDYQVYFYELITTTMERYYPTASPFPLWKEGMEKKVFHPQLHGREHINVPMWLNSLRQNHQGARQAFDKGVFSVIVDKTLDKRIKNTSALYYLNEDEFLFNKQSIIEASKIFEQLFGYKSDSFIAPSFTWDRRIEKVLTDVGVKYIQGLPIHFYEGKRYFNYMGKKSPFGQIYLNRNVEFELSQNPTINNVNLALEQIRTAFRWHKPAIISMHRLNFIGALDVNNRDNNLKSFQELLGKTQKNWPDVEFLTSDELGILINES